MRHVLSSVFATLALICLTGQSWSQETINTSDSAASSAVKVFLDLDGDEMDYYKTHLGFVTFVRDRADADVQMVVSWQNTASGGTKYTLEFRGQGKYASMIDTLDFSVGPGATNDEERKLGVKTMKLGLMRFVARTPQASDVTISYDKPVISTAKIDNWKHWVFSISANGWFQGWKGRHEASVYSNLSANRITKEFKANMSVWTEYNDIKWENGDAEVRSISRGKGISGYVVWGLSNHWSSRAASSAWSSSYGNIESAIDWSAAVEYNIFPYDQSTSRQLRLVYRLGCEYDDYEERTIFEKLTEWTASERISASLKLVQPWGSVTNTLGFSNYMHDFKLNRLDWNTYISLSLVKGLKLNVNGYAARIHDQLAVRAGDATDSDIILRRREMTTSYEYYLSLGLEFSFGSIYSNEVNARFGN